MKKSAVQFGWRTLLGVQSKDYPLYYGNHFSLVAEDGKEYKISNFIYENLKHLLESTSLVFPIEIEILSEYDALIKDSRIPQKFYLK